MQYNEHVYDGDSFSQFSNFLKMIYLIKVYNKTNVFFKYSKQIFTSTKVIILLLYFELPNKKYSNKSNY